MAISNLGLYGATYNYGLTDSLTNSATSSNSSDAAKSTSTVASTAAAIKKAAAAGNSPAAIVSLSNSALAALRAQYSADPANYTAYFPTRSGSDATVLAKAVGNPGAISSSANLNFAEVAQDARVRLDAKYGAMLSSGEAFNADSAGGRDWYTLMSDLDRRSLYAISSNEGGLFSVQEQKAAQAIMIQQVNLATGHYTGPADEAANFKDLFASNDGARYAAARAFLAEVSAEEKQSADWQQQYATASQRAVQAETSAVQAMMSNGVYSSTSDQEQDASSWLSSRSAAYVQLAQLGKL